MLSLVLTPLTLAEYIVFKIKKGDSKWQNLKLHGFTRKQP
jgi:hypothetical protein